MARRLDTDVLVVGAGPAGLSAAYAVMDARNGIRVMLVDENPHPGGQIWRAHLPDFAARQEESLGRFSGGVSYQTTVFDIPYPGLVQTISPHGIDEISYSKLIIATGAREKFLPFPGWTVPNVMGVGGLQALVKGGTDVRNARIVVAGSGPLLVAVANYLEESGAKVFGPFEQTPLGRYARFGLDLLIHPPKLVQAAKMARALQKVRPGKWVTRVLGEDELAVVQLSDGQLIECDYLACAYGFVPNTELAQLAGARLNGETIEVDEFGRTCVQDIYVAGEPAILGGVDTSILTGRIAGLHAAGKEDEARALFSALNRAKKFAKSLDRAFDLRPELRKLAENDTIVCRCEDVCFGDLEDQGDARSAKLQTRCGMGPCQGRICGPITRQIFGWEHNSIRPPLVPVPLGVLATSSRHTEKQ